MWLFVIPSFKDSSSLHTEQNSFHAELVSISPGNSFTLRVTLTLSGSIKQAVFFFLAPVCGGGFTRIFRFRVSSDCAGARILLCREGTVELVIWELVQASLPSLGTLHSELVAIVNRHVVDAQVRRWVLSTSVHAQPQNDVILSQNLPIMLVLCSMLSRTYYAYFSAGIISAPL